MEMMAIIAYEQMEDMEWMDEDCLDLAGTIIN